MKRVILTSGPRGAGKSHYVNNFRGKNSRFGLLSRDECSSELFGRTSFDPYTGEGEYAHRIFFGRVKEALKKPGSVDLIVDCWNGWSKQRSKMIERFRSYGADRVICWKFVTPLDTCINWFMKKDSDEIGGRTESSVEWYYALYHKESQGIEEDGFDKVYSINPLQMELFRL